MDLLPTVIIDLAIIFLVICLIRSSFIVYIGFAVDRTVCWLVIIYNFSCQSPYPKDLPLTNNKTGTSYVKLNMADIGPVQSSQALHFQPDVRRGVAPDARF